MGIIIRESKMHFFAQKDSRKRMRMKYDRSVWQSLTMISQFGINMLVPVLACFFLGSFLDKKMGTSYLVVVLFFVGAVAGGRNCYRFAKRIFDTPSSSEAYIHQSNKKRREAEMKGADERKNH